MIRRLTHITIDERPERMFNLEREGLHTFLKYMVCTIVFALSLGPGICLL